LSPRITVTRLLPPPDDETLKVKGIAIIPAPIVPPLKPHENGVRFLLTNGSGGSLIDVTVPPGIKDASGTGWVAHPTAWTWRSPAGLEGVRIVKVKILGSGPGQIAFKVVAKNASLPLTGADLPLTATIVFDPPQAMTGRCGDLRFPGPAGTAPACEIDPAVTRVRCK
jgi:hypothetical protein